jgi:hypothetical protein
MYTESELIQQEWDRHYGSKNEDGYSEASAQAQQQESEFSRSFKEANKVVHKVEDQWHYEYLTKHGYEPIDKTGVGFVRSYRYQKGDHVICCVTGVNADYWTDKENNGFGYWIDLEPHLSKITKGQE